MTTNSPPCARCGAPWPATAIPVCPKCGAERPGEALSLPIAAASRSILVRDFLIFELKVFLDGAMDLILGPLAAVLFIADLLLGGPRLGGRFYRLLGFGERWDRWLSLYRPAKNAEDQEEGLLAAGAQGVDSLIGRIEGLMRDQRLPERYRVRLGEWAASLDKSPKPPDEDS